LAEFGDAPSPLEVRRADNGKLIADIGTWGNGDDQLTSAWHIDPVQNDTSKVWVYDLSRHRFGLADISDEALEHPAAFREWVTLRSDAALTAPTWAGDSVFSPGFFYTGRIAVFTRDGRFSKFIGLAPTKSNEPTVVTQHAFHSVLASNADRTAFALATRYASHLDIYRRDGSVVRASTPISLEPSYSLAYHAGEPVMSRAPDSRYGYIDVTARGPRIFALFSGRTDAQMLGKAADGTQLHVFDWSGHLIDIFVLPTSAVAISADQGSSKLYVVHSEPRPSIAVYTIPN
jgi:hypothetical protein